MYLASLPTGHRAVVTGSLDTQTHASQRKFQACIWADIRREKLCHQSAD